VNTNRFLSTTVAVLTLFAARATASAQVPEHHILRIGFGGGVSVPTSHAADALKNGINGQAYLLFDPGLGFPLRFNAGYQKFDYKALALDPLATDGNSQILSGVAGLSINLIQLGPLRPYLTAGLGAFNVKDEFTTAGTSASSSTTKFGIDGGGGLALRLGRLEAFVEGRVQNIYTDQGAIDTKSIRAIPVTFGILF
jgi:opacity protein-like surface antigen